MYYQPYFDQEGFEYRQNRQLLKQISKAMNDEFQAVQYYTRLAELAPNKQTRQAILGIRQDEIKHFHWFAKGYLDLSGKYPPLTLGVALPSSFKRGVRDSLKDEQETVPFYRNLASQITDQQFKERILKAADDEHQHAQIFSQLATTF
ncbi:ferritin-like domain-containing protein [Neobacillus sp. PS3-40]|jgi:rubrerythrin|uniref:ferritin-like domain-containing protein n=1 Tax=Neobacillus sp. PS3-40 TaxID=3070679 RepID=UPI0027DFB1EB|nr:ferritin-like domain-containing protein [Neobacillus sp. PS3-40]WML43175.1 ferritin-like domain-containing protein [Neobacillus sp. PS3-40]